MSELQPEWLSPTRLRAGPTIQYDFPGDRFIPNRSLMDLDQARSLLTNPTKPVRNSSFTESYRRKLEAKLSLDSQGNPFRMLVFRGSPKSSRRSIRSIDEMRQDEAEEMECSAKLKPRTLPKKETQVLDAPRIKDDFYTNIMDWGNNNLLAIALGSELYLWNSVSRNVYKLVEPTDWNDYPTSVSWSKDANTLAVGYFGSKLQLWDTETSKLVRSLRNHRNRVGSISWNGNILTSGSLDMSIINHDVRAANNVVSRLETHEAEVCGLKWSESGNMLASGGDENRVYVWHSSKMSSSNFLHCFKDHLASVKALAWCPYQSDILASGGGTKDSTIKLWNIQKGICIKSIDTNAQVRGLEWNRHHKELLSGHGFILRGPRTQLCLWRYPSMTKIGDMQRHSSKILHISQSPDGLTVMSANADETLRLWDLFGPPCTSPTLSTLDGLLSLRNSPIR